ncbi:uncharacterized protein LOC122253826 isoform X1 [Penaeus japonicus]|uniref:uncharacterized protein LOC122253826 isoform X1 n=1 Tax=Penaeus japonicus TaxID=27405 RepID=UPI001C714A5D|nr:uncharacterized protein LOC122253826 isoform X1 [Penaeus japonicus]
MVAIHFVLLPFFLHAVFCLPVLSDSDAVSRRARSLQDMAASPLLGRLARDDGPLLSQWDLTLLGEEQPFAVDVAEGDAVADFPPAFRKGSSDLPADLRSAVASAISKRNEGKIPTMGLGKRAPTYVPYVSVGVLSDMRKFFNELRTNLDSVEEVAALSKEQGLLKSGKIDPADFLALIARHGARLGSAKTGGQQRHPGAHNHIQQLMFGSTGGDKPYAHSGLGK